MEQAKPWAVALEEKKQTACNRHQVVKRVNYKNNKPGKQNLGLHVMNVSADLPRT